MSQFTQQQIDAVPETEAVDFLVNYSGKYGYLLSVQGQYRNKNFLSPAQINKVRECLLVERSKADWKVTHVNPPVAPLNLTYANGTVLMLKLFIAKKMQEQFKYVAPFRNVEVLETLRETEKAVLVRVKLTPRYSTCCSICGQDLDTEISRATGIGPVCAKKWGIQRYASADAKDLLSQLEAQLSQVDINEPVWIARSQIKEVI